MSRKTPYPVAITFIVNKDYSKCKDTHPEKYIEQTTTIKTIVEKAKLTELEVISRDKKGFRQKLIDLDLPLIGYIDIPSYSTGPCIDEYYIVEYSDGAKQLYIMLPPKYEEKHPDMAYQ